MIKYSVLLAFIAFISWLSNSQIEASLKRARSSERDLKHERDSLEVKVVERTRELKDVQAEKLIQMYKLVEFGKLSSGIFHDLLNPLNAVSLNIASLKSASDPNLPEVKAGLDRAMKASRRMEAFLGSVRKQIQVRDFETVFSVKQEMNDILGLLHYKAGQENVGIHVEVEDGLALFGNPLTFNQAILNLAGNAIDSYSGLPQERKGFGVRIRANISSDKKSIAIEISDKGSGIAPEIINKIFDQFYTTKSPDKGSGLGLSTVKTIVEKDFGGSVRVVSTPVDGSVFTISLPRRQPPHPHDTPLSKNKPFPKKSRDTS